MLLSFSSMVILFLMNMSCPSKAGYYHCYSTGNFTSGSDYGNNRERFLNIMATEATNNNGFYYIPQPEAYSNTSFQPSCLGLCRADINGISNACSRCITNCSTTIINNCPIQMDVIAWGADAGCVLRCSTHDFSSSTYDTQPAAHSCNASYVPPKYLQQFRQALANLTSSVAEKAADDGSKFSFSSNKGSLPIYFATQESKLGDLDWTIYALGFCLPTLSRSNCAACLQATVNESERLCNGKQGASIFTPSCILRYELYRFYDLSSPVAPLSSPPPPPKSSPSDVRKEGRNRRNIVIDVVLPMIMVIVLTVIALVTCIVKRVQKKSKQNGADEVGAQSRESCLEFSLHTIKVATNNFSTDNKLGQGGFGTVYKGSLPNGRQIAVKRLTVPSVRGDVEFKNEVLLVARLHHKNLIRLIGFCLQGKERILIYELALYGSLDRFLFDPIRQEQLEWKIRFSIIEDIARGILYLHDGSQLRIIHRDLKAGNILLDESMNAKISDFGTARLFVEDQSSASRIVGTYGYMAPEYVKHGKISVKVDVFSFGVLVLEIVCGKKVSASENPEHTEHLLSKVWKYWTEGNILKLIDPILRIGQAEEITRCIHIGLLCVQEDAACRPIMNSVILMLECASQILPTPLRPAYFMLTEYNKANAPMTDHDHSVSANPDYAQQRSVLSLSSGGFSSVNEVSITQPYPEPR